VNGKTNSKGKSSLSAIFIAEAASACCKHFSKPKLTRLNFIRRRFPSRFVLTISQWPFHAFHDTAL
jgi:hypothetical protein